MQEVTPTLNLYQKMNAVMAEVISVSKGDKKVNGQYKFVSHDEVSRVFQPTLVKHGIVVIPSVEEMLQDGNRTSVKMLVTFVNADNPEEKISIRTCGYGIDSGDKGPGKAVSYALKYAYLKTFCVPSADEDSDHDAFVKYQPEYPQKMVAPEYEAEASEKDLELLRETLKSVSPEKRERVEKYIVDQGASLSSMKASMFRQIYKRLKNG